MTDIAIGAVLPRRRRVKMPSPIIAVALLIVVAVIVLALFGRWLEPHPPQLQTLLDVNQPPSHTHWFGTDALGRDITSRVIAGARTALLGPLVVAATGAVLSSLLGIASGYFGGAIDMVIQRYVDFMFALPGLLIAIVVVGVVGGGYWLAVAVLSLLNFSGDVRIVRGAVIEQRPLPYVEAARTLGVPRRRIMYVHILRNIVAILFANAALDFALALVALAGLAFLGLGSQLGSPEWGRMLAENKDILFTNPAAALAPGVAIVLVATSVTLIGDWIYDRFAYSGRSGR
ncbi:MAG TPA: ABC transporter permease [Gaiellaceae bacterium]|nr:ABC transporter permease [Gaiellaceae bacterium]